jgi:alkanesulfonate monooxygenase SsuD/methylene tetrahydromethanopterin reductase-like flavin-dependent oxidoreductase (luciferase family)
VGYRDAEFQTFNVPLKERAQRMNESIEIMRRLWIEDKITHNGKIFQINDLGIGLKPQQGAGRRSGLRRWWMRRPKRAAQLGDAWLITNLHI